MEHLRLLMAHRAQRDPVLGDVTTVGHQVPVGDVVGIEQLISVAAAPALEPIPSERSITEVRSDPFLLGRHHLMRCDG